MRWKPELAIFLLPAVLVLLLLAGVFFLAGVRSGGEEERTVGLTATAALQSPDGASVGTVTFRQAATGVLIMADVKGLTPGGHAFIIHETGACTPDFNAAGDHFNPTDAEHGFIHAAWKRGAAGGHGGDLPNIYAAADGSARADFFTEGITLDLGADHSIFDDDGAAIIVHEKPDAYGEEEADTGARLACGVITST